MSYLLLMLFPLAMAGGSFVGRRNHTFVAWIGVLAIAVELWLVLSAPLDRPARVLELSVTYNEWGRLFLATVCAGSLTAAVTALVIPLGEYFITTLLLILSGSAAILIIQEPFVVAALLLLLSLISSIQLVDPPGGGTTLLRPPVLSMAIKYTLLSALGGLLLLIGFVLATAYDQQLAASGPVLTRAVFGLLLVGYSVRVGLIPFHLWLPDVVDETPPPTFWVQTGLLSALAVPVLLVALQTQPQLLVGNVSGQRLLIGLGALSAVLGGGFALVTQVIRRAIAFLVIANLGLITVGLGIATVTGVSAALLGVLNHVIGVALVALGLSLLERTVPGRREQAGAMRERPLAAATFATGVLVLLGVPPLSGFAPKLMLLVASRDAGVVAWLVLAGVVIMGFACARLLRRVLLQPREGTTTRSLFSDDLDRLAMIGVSYAPRPLLIFVVLLLIGCFLLGVWPQPIVAQLDTIVRELAFLRQ